MKTSEVLLAARKLIEREEDWCRDIATLVKEDGTYAYCTSGAVDTVCKMRNMMGYPMVEHAEVLFCRAMGILCECAGKEFSYSAVTYNDKNTHKDVMRLFAEAIQIAQARERVLEDIPEDAPVEATPSLIPANFTPSLPALVGTGVEGNSLPRKA